MKRFMGFAMFWMALGIVLALLVERRIVLVGLILILLIASYRICFNKK